MKKLAVLSTLMVLLPSVAMAEPLTTKGKALGYSIEGCQSVQSSINYCSKAGLPHFEKVVASAKATTKPNFDKDKKLVYYRYKDTYDYRTDVFVFDDKSKKAYLFPNGAIFEKLDGSKATTSPKPTYSVNSDWFCFSENEASFDYEEVEGYIVTHPATSNISGLMACGKFKVGKIASIHSAENFNDTKELDKIYDYK